MRTGFLLLAGMALWGSAEATTLQKLSLDDMIQQSTAIVRARVTGSRTAQRGANIYTYYRLHVLEAAKSPRPGAGVESSGQGNDIEVAVSGGTLNGLHQMAIGSPELTQGSEYVLFLWTGKSGLTQIIGLSQGLFAASKDASGQIRLNRAAGDEPMLDQSGRMVPAEPVSLNWSDLRSRIHRELASRTSVNAEPSK